MTRQTSAADECLGQVLSGVLVLGTVCGCRLPGASAPLGDGEGAEHHEDVMDGPAPLRGKELVDDDLGVERSVEERDEDDDDQRNDRDRGEDETELGSSGETLGTEECDE